MSKAYVKEELAGISKQLAEQIAAAFPELPFLLICTSSDGVHFFRMQSNYLCDPAAAIKSLSENISHLTSGMLQDQLSMFSMFEQQQVAQAVGEAKDATKN